MKSHNSERTVCCRAMGPWKMETSLDFAIRSLCSSKKKFRKKFLHINISQKYLISTSLWKSPNSERTFFSRAMGPKKMNFSLDLQSKLLCFGQKNFKKIFFFKLSKLMAGQKKWKSKGNRYKKVQILEEPFILESPKKMDSPLNLQLPF